MKTRKQSSILVNTVSQKILRSKKYKGLDPCVVELIVSENEAKYRGYSLEKEVRNKLHQIWAMYLRGGQNYPKFLKELRQSEGESIKVRLLPVLSRHSSTFERLGFLEDFYKKIFALTGAPEIIVDIGCGFNPLAVPWMNLVSGAQYWAFDIDGEEVTFLNEVCALLKIKNVFAQTRTAVESYVRGADVVLILKLLPVLEQQKTGLARELLEKQSAHSLVISFPKNSLSGKEKGMSSFYSDYLRKVMLGLPYELQRLEFENELVFVAIKKS